MPWSLINLAGCLNAFLLAAVLVMHPRLRRSSATHYLAAILALAAVVVGLITLEHADLVWPTTFLLWLEEWLSLLVGPLLLGYVFQAVRGRHPPWMVHLPWLVHLAAFVVAGGAVREWLRIEHVMWIQMIYTAAGAAVWIRARRESPVAAPAHVGLVLVIFAAVHAAQVVRFFWFDVDWLQDVVPWVASASFFTLIGYALVQSRALAGLVAPVVDPARQSALEAVARRVDSVMRGDKPWLEPGLTLESLASRSDCAPAELSAALNRHLGMTFFDYVNQFRVEEARRLLTAPEEQRYSVDGIGLQAGFGSRSGFYKVFKVWTGQSPAEYRRANQPG